MTALALGLLRAVADGARLVADAPLAPDGDTARDLLGQELAKPEYAETQLTWFDRLANALLDFLNGLFQVPEGGSFAAPVVYVVIGLLILGVVVYFVVRGLRSPIARRAAADAGVFDDGDRARSAREHRAAAASAADAGDFRTAVEEQFRALARGLAERTVIGLRPGTTAHEITASASRSFPDRSADLELVAGVFEHARYFEREMTRDDWDRVRSLDAELERARPVALEAVGGVR